MRIYTKTGDKGKTSLFDGTRVRKDNIRVDTYGILDELNSIVGVCVSMLEGNTKFIVLTQELQLIQNDLFDMGAMLADLHTDTSKEKKQHRYLRLRVKQMEKHIDRYTATLPQQRTFILPGGGSTGAFLHVARTICRRAERRITTLAAEESIVPELIVYINRLSDYLFAASRFVNHSEKRKEIFWKKKIV